MVQAYANYTVGRFQEHFAQELTENTHLQLVLNKIRMEHKGVSGRPDSYSAPEEDDEDIPEPAAIQAPLEVPDLFGSPELLPPAPKKREPRVDPRRRGWRN